MRIASEKQEVRIVAIQGDFDAGRPLYVQTADVAELRTAVETIDPSIMFEVVKPVSPVFAVAYLATHTRKDVQEREGEFDAFTLTPEQIAQVRERILPESDIRRTA